MKRICVIGGRANNIPRWAQAAFDIEHIDRDEGKGKFAPERPDAIVVNVDFVSHQYSAQAHEWGSTYNVPVLHARSGWSSALEEAAKVGVDWFVQAVQAAGRAMTSEQLKEAQEVVSIVDSAWSSAVAYERERAEAAIRRLSKERAGRERAEDTLRRLRAGAEQRIVGEIRRHAAEMRAEMAQRNAEIRERVSKLAEAAFRAIATAAEANAKLSTALNEVESAAQLAMQMAKPELPVVDSQADVRPSGSVAHHSGELPSDPRATA